MSRIRSLCTVMFIVLFQAAAYANYTITTIAGTGEKGYLGDGGLSVSAQLGGKDMGVAADDFGNIYIADYGNNKVRKIDTNGIITTIAGTGFEGYSGDGESAVNAQLNCPRGIAVDKSGNIYITDQSNHRIRKIDKNGIITTIAGTGVEGYSGDGGLAVNAQLKYPRGIALSQFGEIYIADSDNNAIRKIDSAGIISTITNKVYAPFGITLDNAGNIYTVSYNGLYVAKIDRQGEVSVFAGIGEAGYNNDGFLAINAKLNWPYDIAADNSGNVFITDRLNHRIRKVDTSGIITTIAGTGTGGYSGDAITADTAQINGVTGIAIDKAGNIYIADSDNFRIRKCAPDSSQEHIYAIKGYIKDANGAGISGVTLTLSGTSTGRYTTDSSGYYEFLSLCSGGSFEISAAAGDYIFEPSKRDYTSLNKIEESQNFTAIPKNVGNYITTVAGISAKGWINGGYSGDGGPAVFCELNMPRKIFIDSKDNIYIADVCNHKIRKIDSNGIITTIAGTGTSAGYSGDGDHAVFAQMDAPWGLTMDFSGNIYIADRWNNVIRKIDTNGIITTIAGTGIAGYSGDGGLSIYSQINQPTGLTIDSKNNIYITDAGNSVIRKIDTNGIITTIAGKGTFGYSGDGGQAVFAEFSSPEGIAIDLSNNIYIADTGNSVIRKIDTNGVITTIAGTGIRDYSGDGGLAVYAGLSSPESLVIDSFNNIYIADTYNYRIRKIDATGIITTIAGTGIADYSGDGGFAVSAQIDTPSGIAIDSLNNIYISDTFNHRIRKIILNENIKRYCIKGYIKDSNGIGISGVTVTLSGAKNQKYTTDANGCYEFINLSSGGIYNITPCKDGYAFNSETQVFENLRENKENVNFTGVEAKYIITTIAGTGNEGYNGDNFSAVSAQVGLPCGVVLDSKGNIYVADYSNNRVRKIDNNGIITTLAGTGEAGYSGDGGNGLNAMLNHPMYVAVDALDNVYVADMYNNCIRKVDAKTCIITTIAGTGTAGYSGDGGLAVSAALNGPWAVTTDSQGNVYITDTGNSCIRKVDKSGIITTIAGTPGAPGYSGDGGLATAAKLNNAYAIAVDEKGDLYISEYVNNRIRKVDTNGIITTIAGSGTIGYGIGGCSGDGGPAVSAELNSPVGITVGPSGSLYIADFWNNRIRKIDEAGIITTVAGCGNIGFANGGYDGDGGAATAGKISGPHAIAFDLSGNMYISDTHNNRIRKCTLTGSFVEISTPVISNVSSSEITANSAAITWETDQNSDSQVEYWTAGSAIQSYTDTAFVTKHKIMLGGILDGGVTYHYRVKSNNINGKTAVSDEYEFTTPDKITNYEVNKTVIITGKSNNDCDKLKSIDNNYMEIEPVKISNKYLSDWYAVFKLPKNHKKISKLIINYTGFSVNEIENDVTVKNAAENKWEKVKSLTIKPEEETFSIELNNPENYIAANGAVYVRFRTCVKKINYTIFSDCLKLGTVISNE